MQTQPTHSRTSPATAAARGEGGPSLAEMAQRDLDAALQLLADRAQYITGASGAAIALRRDGKNDMLCRASSGSNAPELGALLSTEFGLSGESVRTRQALRCDDAERDVRVNREVCRQMGIASVVVMPVVNDDEVLGVFELFSGKANAFGTRDVSAVQRLSQMVETAVRLAQATQNLPERLKMSEVSATEVKAADVREEQILEGDVLGDVTLDEPVPEDSVLEEQDPIVKVAPETNTSGAEAPVDKESSIAALEPLRHPNPDSSENRGASTPELSKAVVPENVAAAPAVAATAEPGPVAAPETEPKKKLFWSAALNPVADAARPEEPDQSHVPPVLRSLRKCEACGFPVSAGRVLCVECEEKKWRGHLKVPKVVAPLPMATPPSRVSEKAGSGTSGAEALKENKSSAAPEARALAAAAQSNAAQSNEVRASMPPMQSAPAAVVVSRAAIPAAPEKESKQVAGSPAVAPASNPAVRETASPIVKDVPPEFVLSAGMAPSQSWLSANKYILGVLLVVGGVVAAVFLLR
jgi:GAF domain-containing protein